MASRIDHVKSKQSHSKSTFVINFPEQGPKPTLSISPSGSRHSGQGRGQESPKREQSPVRLPSLAKTGSKVDSSTTQTGKTSSRTNEAPKKNEKAKGSLVKPLSASFDQYDFYVNRVLQNNATLKELAKKKEEALLRKSVTMDAAAIRNSLSRSSYTVVMATERLNEWVTEAYKDRYRDVLRRESGGNGKRSKTPGDVEDDEEANELLESLSPLRQTFKMVGRQAGGGAGPGRRASIFWAPPEIIRKQHRTFKSQAGMIRSIVRLFLDMKRLSVSKTEQTAYSEMLYISAGATTHAGQQGEGEEGKKLLFDKSWFNRNRARSRMPIWAENLMNQPPNKRPQEELNHLKQLLLTMKDFREKMTEDMRTKICQVVRYTKCDKGRVILRQGHVGYDFYFIFSGSVFIQIDIYDPKTEETHTSVENVLRTGEGFGEIALLGDGKRTASVICKEPTELCQIDKTTFLEVCPAMFKELLDQKIAFAQQYPLFQMLEPDILNKLCFLSQILEIPHSTVIERNWANTSYAYFVMNGRMSMLKEFDVTDIIDKLADSRCLYDDHEGQPRVLKMNKSATAKKNEKHHTRFAHCGSLSTGGHTDLGVLSSDPRDDIDNITVVSEGCRLFRVAARTFIRLSPRKPIEDYLKKAYNPPRFPSEEELYAHYLRNLRWMYYKTNMLKTCTPGEKPYMSAAVPATHKGSTGWAKWPGFVIQKKQKPTNVAIAAVAEAQSEKSDSLPANASYGDFYIITEEEEEEEEREEEREEEEEGRRYDDDQRNEKIEQREMLDIPTDLRPRRRSSAYFDQSILDEMGSRSRRLTSDHSMTLAPRSLAPLLCKRDNLPKVL